MGRADVVVAGATDGRPVDDSDPRLEDLRLRLERAEADLRSAGYVVQRSVLHPGSRISSQLFNEDLILLLLYGRLRIESDGEVTYLGPSDRLEVPAGVPAMIESIGERSSYLLYAWRPPLPDDESSGNRHDGPIGVGEIDEA